MMMTESYYHGDDEAMYRSPRRRIPPPAYYGRGFPYGYYDHGRQGQGQQWADRQDSHATIQEVDVNTQGDQQTRRRIAVACSRCRKRKIKCSGDPGDGSGCGACKSVGSGLAQSCTFIRVKSQPVPMAGLEMLTHGAFPGMLNASPFDSRLQTGDRRVSERHERSRPPIPVLHTRTAVAPDLDSPATNSPIDAYPYGPTTMPRQDSLVSTNGTESMHSCSTTCSPAPPPMLSYCDPHTGYSFGSMQVSGPQHFTRLPSVSTDSLSPLNMGHLNSSLPSHSAQDRRLPIPHISQYQQPQFPMTEPAGPRPLGSFSNPRIPMNGIHNRNAVPWTLDTISSRAGSISNYIPPRTFPMTSSHPMPIVSESMMGYQFHPSTAPSVGYGSSPELSPTSGPTLSTSFGSSSSSSGESNLTMQNPMSSMRSYTAVSSQQDMTPVTSSDRPSSSRQKQQQTMPSLYSFGPASSDFESTSPDQDGSGIPSSGLTQYALPVRDGRGSLDGDAGSYVSTSDGGYSNSLQHPRPLGQQSASIESLCRQSPSAASRMSISNFNDNYQ